MNPELVEALRELEREKGIAPQRILEALEAALLSAYRRNYGEKTEARIEINKDTGEIKVFSSMKAKEGEEQEKELEVEVTPADFGRIAAQTAKQVILQKIREAEREKMFDEYSDRKGDIVTGVVEQKDQRYTLVSLGKVEALLPPPEQVPGEKYNHGARLKTYIVEVRRTTKEPQIIVSRTHPGLIRKLFELEVPEIYDGLVEIKSVAREPGHRSKIAVFSSDKNIDPVGACVGSRGSRVKMVVSELRGEKIDIVEWNEDPKVFVAQALSPAKVKQATVDEKRKKAEVIVPDDQLSLAIGKEGQNARLAAKLTGLRIDIKSESQAQGEAEKVKKVKKVEEGRCQAKTAAGKPCKNRAKPGSKYCGRHQKAVHRP